MALSAAPLRQPESPDTPPPLPFKHRASGGYSETPFCQPVSSTPAVSIPVAIPTPPGCPPEEAGGSGAGVLNNNKYNSGGSGAAEDAVERRRRLRRRDSIETQRHRLSGR